LEGGYAFYKIKETDEMAKKGSEMKSHTLLKIWGAVSMVGLAAYLATYNEDAKPLSIKKKPWQITLFAIFVALVSMGALVGLYFLLHHFFFPDFSISNKWIFLIYVITVFIIGSVFSIVEFFQYRNR
jgi:hypothetical protein